MAKWLEGRCNCFVRPPLLAGLQFHPSREQGKSHPLALITILREVKCSPADVPAEAFELAVLPLLRQLDCDASDRHHALLRRRERRQVLVNGIRWYIAADPLGMHCK